ncbi:MULTISPECIES: hypothetical protein [unclassified Gilliamella]|uniref:hypothetical protein n=1 Tax=unclassified Gilliamella TaxID=2685620 RepID=UPI0018DC3953|nr:MULTISPECIES: hypothetical protein [unclassified Gilliamella]MBI0114232.1 hypothetical protein [Gilliamella sp. W8123]MBI0117769.1 hypothetical protein [Gilliamella sp. W8129]
MARTAKQTKEAVELPTINEQSINNTMNTLTTIQSEYNEERDLVNQLLGQSQMADAFAKFSNTVFISKLSYVKENKLYQYITNNKSEDASSKNTWEGFCKLLGWTPQHANEAIANLHSLGEEALESMSRMGIGYRELRQYRKLPEDQKTALIEVAKAGDKETLVELAEEFIAKNTKEKEQLKKENSNLQADYKALSKRNADVAQEKEELAIKLAQFEMKTIPLDDRLSPLKEQIAKTQSHIDELLEQQRQYLQIVDNLQREIIDNDPNYDPEKHYQLPESLVVTLTILYQSLKLTSSQSKRIYFDFWNNFSDDIEIDPNETAMNY